MKNKQKPQLQLLKIQKNNVRNEEERFTKLVQGYTFTINQY